MKRNVLAGLAACLSMISLGAQAATFNLSIRGPGEYFDWYTQLGTAGGDPYLATYWLGGMTVETSSNADGTYTGNDLQLIDFTSNWGEAFTYHAGDTKYWQYDVGGDSLVGMEPGASVTISGGKVASLDFTWDWPYGGITVDGLSASANGWWALYPTAGDVELSGIVHTVPEPFTPAMMLLGLGLIAARRRINKP